MMCSLFDVLMFSGVSAFPVLDAATHVAFSCSRDSVTHVRGACARARVRALILNISACLGGRQTRCRRQDPCEPPCACIIQSRAHVIATCDVYHMTLTRL